MWENSGSHQRVGSRVCGAALVLFAFAVPLHLSAQASFRGLGDIPGGVVSSAAQGISDDGSTVVGQASSDSGFEAFCWTEAGGMTGLGFVSGGFGESVAFDCSADGSVVVGQSTNIEGGVQGFRWDTTSGIMTALNDLPGGEEQGAAYAVSADGSMIVGSGQTATDDEAVRWSSGTDAETIHDGVLFFRTSGARAVSPDGLVVGGFGYSEPETGVRGYLWTGAGGMSLGSIPGASGDTYVNGISDAGDVAVGWGLSASSLEAFRWTIDGGMASLGLLTDGFFSEATAVSADGSIVVGNCMTFGGNVAFVWEESLGMVPMSDFLTANGIDVAGWTLTHAAGISADGSRIVGSGINPDGEQEAWLADLGTSEGDGSDEEIDSDGDGISDAVDAVPNSDTSPTLVIAGIDTGVANVVLSDGSTLADMIAAADEAAETRGQFLHSVLNLARQWVVDGSISKWDRWAIWKAAERARWKPWQRGFGVWWRCKWSLWNWHH